MRKALSGMLHAFVVACCVVSLLGGCSSWRWIQGDDIETRLSTEHPKKVRVALPDRVIEIRDPIVENDSLTARAAVLGGSASGRIALGEIDSLAIRSFSRPNARAIAFSALALSIVFVVLANRTPSSL